MRTLHLEPDVGSGCIRCAGASAASSMSTRSMCLRFGFQPAIERG